MSHVLSAVAWPYANGPRHIGHVAGFGVPSDVFSRYMRMAGHEVLMVSGTDEHGTPILVAADAAGVSAKDLADKNNAVIVQDLVDLGLSYDLFTRTTTGNHYNVVQELFATVHRNGYMVEQTTKGAVSPSTGRTLPDRYIEGTCPICGYGEARGDQCDNCGNQLDPTDLIEDLRPRAMTRDLDWGIPIPLDGWRDHPTKRMYVWFDAVIGYLSASIEWARRLGEPERWRDWWNDPEALSYYFMGKDNIVFHSLIWPAELLAYDGKGAIGGEPGPYGDLQLPTEIVSSEFMTMESKQFSTSRGHVILVGDMLSRYQPDALRYYICAAGPETSDSDFTWADFVLRTNSELVAGWGNLVNRTATMIAKSFGEIPEAGPLEAVDEAVLDSVRRGFDTVGAQVGRQRLRNGIAEAMRVVGEVNKYLTVTEPYKMKDEAQRERLATVLHVAAQCVLDCNTILAPFLPFSANAVWATFGGEGEFMPMPRIDHVEDLDPDNGAGLHVYPIITGDYSGTPAWESRPVVVGAKVDKPTPVFTKLDPSVVEEELARLDG
jgi:methionyl-tRNA synthetase